MLTAGGDGLSPAGFRPFSSASGCLPVRRLRGGGGVNADSCPCRGLCAAAVGDSLSTTLVQNWCCAAALALARLAGHHCNKDSSMAKPCVSWWTAFCSNPCAVPRATSWPSRMTAVPASKPKVKRISRSIPLSVQSTLPKIGLPTKSSPATAPADQTSDENVYVREPASTSGAA